MPIATLTNIEKTFGRRVLFDKLTLDVERGERIGLIGDNGSGKSTLFKVLVGQMSVDSGTVGVHKSVRVGYLTQDPVFDASNSVMDEAEQAFADLHRQSHRLREIEQQMAVQTGEALQKTLEQYQKVQHAFELGGGYDWRHKLEATLQGVGLEPRMWDQLVGTLSGGQKSRLSLAKVLIAEPDLLLLDEPTNHLDLAAIEWLEKYLASYSGAVVLISHDRFLLDRLTTRIVWLTQSHLQSYPGNYSAFVQQRELAELSQQRAYDKQQEDIAKQQEFVRRFGAGQRSREAKGRQKRLERFLSSDQLVQQVQASHSMHLSLGTDQRAGDQVLQVRELSKAYDQHTLWKEISFHVERGQRVGILGPNGTGKTTLLEVLLGRRQADAGVVRWGANLKLGYYDQKLDDFDPSHTVLEEAANGRLIPEQKLRTVLGTMLFRGEDVFRPMSVLSGGERARVALVQLLLDEPNVLLLDEPTNHLDIASREALERALCDFAGTILCVSHDRFFLDRVAQRLLVLDRMGVVDYDGNYSAYAAAVERKKQAEAERVARSSKPPARSVTPARPAASKSSRGDNPYLRPFGRLSVKQLEAEIVQTEVELSDCQSAMAEQQVFRDPAHLQRVQMQFKDLTDRLEQLEAEYFTREM